MTMFVLRVVGATDNPMHHHPVSFGAQFIDAFAPASLQSLVPGTGSFLSARVRDEIGLIGSVKCVPGDLQREYFITSSGVVGCIAKVTPDK